MNEKLIGKKVKINDYNLNYGSHVKYMNIICFYKYLKDNNIYAICCEDSNIPYGIINYGSAYLKENTLIVIGTKDPNQDMLKEIIFKIHNKEPLDDLEIIDLSNVDLIELMSPNKFEVKKEVLESVVDKTIPVPKEEVETKPKGKKKKSKIFPIMLVLIILCGAMYYFLFFNNGNQNNVVKTIACTKEYPSNEMDANILEDNTYYFNQDDSLEYVNKSTTYRFNVEDDYLDFINKGLFYSYIPEDNIGYTLDDITYSLIVIEKEETTKDYFLPTDYEEVLVYYKDKGYECIEQTEE